MTDYLDFAIIYLVVCFCLSGRKAGCIFTQLITRLKVILKKIKIKKTKQQFSTYISKIKFDLLIELKKRLFVLGMILIILCNYLPDSVVAIQPVDEAILSGSGEALESTLKTIDSYTPLINEDTYKINNSNNNDFVAKPIINKTVTRYEMDKKRRDVYARDQIRSTKNNKKISNGYLYGFCTWFVANKRIDIPDNWGNAKNWLGYAQKINWPTGNDPKIGAIVVTNESWAGHVAYVESVNNNTIVVSEMNKIGWNRQSTRVIPINSKIIKGYIY